MLPDLARGLGIDFPARQRGEFVADIHHRVSAFAFTVIDSKAEADRASLTPDSAMKRSLLSICRAGFTEAKIGQFCPNVKLFGQKSPTLAGS
jgi:hypothetical protein